MKPRSLALRLALNSGVMILLVYLLMQTFVFFRDSVFVGPGSWADYSGAVFGFVGGRVVPPLVVFGILLWFWALPIQRAAVRLESGAVLSDAEAEQTRARILRFRSVVLGVNLVGFTVGFFLDLALSNRLGELAQVHRLTVLGGNLCGAFVFSAAQSALNNLALAPLRDRLGITSLGNRRRETTTTVRQHRLSVALVLYALFVLQYNQHDVTVYQSWGTEVMAQVSAGTLPADQAADTYRKLVVSRIGTISSRTITEPASLPLPWEHPGSAVGSQEGTFLILGFLMVAIAVLVQGFVSQEQRDSIGALQARIRDVVAGGGDLRRRLSLRAMDDLGELADLNNRLLDQFQGIVGRIGTAAEATRDGVKNVQDELAKAEAVAGQVGGAVAALRAELEDQMAQSRRLTEALGEFRSAAAAVDAEAGTQGRFVDETAQSMAALAQGLEEGRRQSRDAETLTESLATQGEGGGQAVDETGRAILAIRTSSEEVLRVLSALKKIASDTNLLAMNAAIEAAHAGDRGAGFAVVADEVRKLATTAQAQNQAIKELIHAMAAQVAAGVDRAQTAGTVLRQLVDGLHGSAQASAAVAGVLEDQSRTTHQVTESLSQVVRTSEAIRHKMADQNATTDRMAESLDRALGRLDNLAETSRRQTEAVAGLEASFAEVRRQVEANAESAEALKSEVLRFQV